VYFSYLVVLFYCHLIWFYLTCLNEINGDGDGIAGTTALSSDRTPHDNLDAQLPYHGVSY